MSRLRVQTPTGAYLSVETSASMAVPGEVRSTVNGDCATDADAAGRLSVFGQHQIAAQSTFSRVATVAADEHRYHGQHSAAAKSPLPLNEASPKVADHYMNIVWHRRSTTMSTCRKLPASGVITSGVVPELAGTTVICPYDVPRTAADRAAKAAAADRYAARCTEYFIVDGTDSKFSSSAGLRPTTNRSTADADTCAVAV